MKKAILIAIIITAFTSIISADTITLKDEQEFKADVVSFDKFFIVAKIAGGQEISIPWREVMSVSHTTTPESWLEATYITVEPAEVNTLVVPLSPEKALFRSINPGIVIHGSGFFYAKDTNMGMSLLSAEIVSVIIMAISSAEFFSPAQQDDTYVVTRNVFIAGAAIFGGSWLYDIIFSGGAADKYNKDNKFLMEKDAKDEGSAGK